MHGQRYAQHGVPKRHIHQLPLVGVRVVFFTNVLIAVLVTSSPAGLCQSSYAQIEYPPPPLPKPLPPPKGDLTVNMKGGVGVPACPVISTATLAAVLTMLLKRASATGTHFCSSPSSAQPLGKNHIKIYYK